MIKNLFKKQKPIVNSDMQNTTTPTINTTITVETKNFEPTKTSAFAMAKLGQQPTRNKEGVSRTFARIPETIVGHYYQNKRFPNWQWLYKFYNDHK